MTRDEHMAWCKERAIKYLDSGDLVNAMASFTSDMSKHPETDQYMCSPAISMLAVVDGFGAVRYNDARRLRRFVEGCR
jgi:hypothetical protein